MIRNAGELFNPDLSLSKLCNKAGFVQVYSGPEQVVGCSETGYRWEPRRLNLERFPKHLSDFLGMIDISQREYEFSPKPHFLFAREIDRLHGLANYGVEMFHFWDDRKWQVEKQTQIAVRGGLAYYCLPDASVVSLAVKTAGDRRRKLILLDEFDIWPDKWDFEALRRLMLYANILSDAE